MKKYNTLFKLKNKIIGVLYGGVSDERNISISSGKAVINSLKTFGFNVCGIDVDEDIINKIKKKKIDIACIMLHGPIGEDGTIQGMLEVLGIPYTGSGIFASSLSINKDISKKFFKFLNIPTPKWTLLKKNEKLKKINKYPVVVKPLIGGSALNITIAKKEKDINKSIDVAFKFKHSDKIIIEEYISGKEITVGVLYGKPLPIIEIIPKYEFYDFRSKYQKNASKHIIPAKITNKLEKLASNYAIKIYKNFCCNAACRVDMIIDKNDKIWVLENNTIPGMTKTSLLPDMAKAIGCSFDNLVLEILKSAIL
jgi:D-alanine-D-alanine ligase